MSQEQLHCHNVNNVQLVYNIFITMMNIYILPPKFKKGATLQFKDYMPNMVIIQINNKQKEFSDSKISNFY